MFLESNLKLKGFVVNLFLFGSLLLSVYLTTLIHKDFVKEITSGNTEHIWTFGIITAVLLVIIIALSIAFSKIKSATCGRRVVAAATFKSRAKGASYEGDLSYSQPTSFQKGQKRCFNISECEIKHKKSYEHVLLLGPSGSGKSAQFFKPNLRNIDDTSIVVTDPKGELHLETSDFLEAKGYRVLHLNFNEPKSRIFIIS